MQDFSLVFMPGRHIIYACTYATKW